MTAEDYKKILDTYWPVIEASRKIRAFYMGEQPGEPKRICSDVVGDLIMELQKAQSKVMVEQV